MLAVITFMGGGLMMEGAEPPPPAPPARHVPIRAVIATFVTAAGFVGTILVFYTQTKNLVHRNWASWLLLFLVLACLFGVVWLIQIFWSAIIDHWLMLAKIGVGVILLMVLAGVIVGDVRIWSAVPGEAVASPPPDVGTVTGLMNEEIEAAMTHDISVVSRIYDQNAVVMDAACGSPGGARIWTGLNDIHKEVPGAAEVRLAAARGR